MQSKRSMICLDGSQFLPSHRIVMKRTRKTRRQSAPAVVGLTLLLLLFTILMGIGLAQAIEPKSVPAAAELLGKPMTKETPKPEPIGTVDPLSDRERAGQALYLENCASCHLGIPPAVMPTQTWQALLQDPQHYGISIDLPQDPERRILWNYVKTASRPTATASDRVPYRISESRYMRALHPKVKFPEKQGLTTCISCHPSAKDFNFRKLTPEAENSP